jgi:hypothetical protein
LASARQARRPFWTRAPVHLCHFIPRHEAEEAHRHADAEFVPPSKTQKWFEFAFAPTTRRERPPLLSGRLRRTGRSSHRSSPAASGKHATGLRVGEGASAWIHDRSFWVEGHAERARTAGRIVKWLDFRKRSRVDSGDLILSGGRASWRGRRTNDC